MLNRTVNEIREILETGNQTARNELILQFQTTILIDLLDGANENTKDILKFVDEVFVPNVVRRTIDSAGLPTQKSRVSSFEARLNYPWSTHEKKLEN